MLMVPGVRSNALFVRSDPQLLRCQLLLRQSVLSRRDSSLQIMLSPYVALSLSLLMPQKPNPPLHSPAPIQTPVFGLACSQERSLKTLICLMTSGWRTILCIDRDNSPFLGFFAAVPPAAETVPQYNSALKRGDDLISALAKP
jgi:hypothetical protein